MKYKNTFTISDLLACLETGGKLIGTEKGNGVALSKNDVDCIRLLNEDGNENSVIVNDKSIVKIEFMIFNTVDVKKVDKVVKYNKQKRDINLYIKSNYDVSIEEISIKYIMLIKLLCEISLIDYNINVVRFDNANNIDNDEYTFKLVIGENINTVNKLNNFIPLDTTNRDTKSTIVILCSYLRLNKLINQDIVSFVFDEYASGKLQSDIFKLWIEAYNQFYGFEPNKKFLLLPESINRDQNTDMIILYLITRYRQEKNKKKLNKVTDSFIEFKAPEISNIVGSAKFIVDRCLDKIKQKYVISMAEKSNGLKVIVDYNDLIHPEEIRKNIETGYCLVTMRKGESNIDVDIVVYLANHTIMSMITKSDYIKTLMEKYKINSYTVEYTEI